MTIVAAGVLLRPKSEVRSRPHDHAAPRRPPEYFLSDAVVEAFALVEQQKLNAIRLRQR